MVTVYLGKIKDEKLQTVGRRECIKDFSGSFLFVRENISSFLNVFCVVADRILSLLIIFSFHKFSSFRFPLRDEIKYHSKHVDLPQNSNEMLCAVEK